MMNDKQHRMWRRTFLGGLGATAMAPFLRPMMAHAVAGTAPQRLLIIHRPCGSRLEKWFPTTGGVKDWGMTTLLQPFEKLRNKMVIMKGINSPRIQDWLGDKHGAGMLSMMTPPVADKGPQTWPIIPGYDPKALSDTNAKFFTAPDMSVDQELQQKVPAFQGTPIKTLELGSSLQSMKGTGDHCLRVISYAGFNQPLWPESRPATAFQNVFGQTMTGGMDPAALARLNAQNKSVLDFAIGDLNSIRAKAPKSQYQKIDSHLAAVRELETNIATAGVPKACVKPTLDALPAVTGGGEDDAKHALASKEMLQIVQAAFACDLTRVVTLTYGYGNSDLHFNKIIGIADTEGHHNMSHAGTADAITGQELADKFYNQTTADALLAMDGIVEANGQTMLDNTLVVYWNECSVGADHKIEDIPVALFGGKNLGLQGGSFLKFTAHTFADIWVETFARLGYNKTQYGAAMWNKGALPGVYA
jgi:hypothetical protein